jgi:hypothetical protein
MDIKTHSNETPQQHGEIDEPLSINKRAGCWGLNTKICIENGGKTIAPIICVTNMLLTAISPWRLSR